MKLSFQIPRELIEERRQRIRDVWEYKKVDYIPILMSVYSNPWGYSVKEMMLDHEKLFKVNLETVKNSLKMIPDDYLPAMRPDVGCIVIASAFGAEVYYGPNPEQTPYIKKPIIKNINEVYKLDIPDPYRDGLMPRGLECIRYFVENTDYKIPVSCLDMGGPINVAGDLLGTDLLFFAMYEAPEALHHLLDLLAETFVLFADVSIKAAGGIDNITCTDFPSIWCPEGRKGHVSDDLCASYSPEFFNKFSKPANNKIFKRFGGGMLHNCGPNPCLSEYLNHDPPIKDVDLSYQYSKDDLQKISETFAGRGIVYFYFENTPPQHVLEEYRYIMETLAPEVVAIPCFEVFPQDPVEEIYRHFLVISREYARRMEWKR